MENKIEVLNLSVTVKNNVGESLTTPCKDLTSEIWAQKEINTTADIENNITEIIERNFPNKRKRCLPNTKQTTQNKKLFMAYYN